MENLNNGESSSSNQNIRSRIQLLPQPQLVDLLCTLASLDRHTACVIEALANALQATPDRKLFVCHLAERTSSQTLRLVFQVYGVVEDAFVVRDRYTRISKKYGFVTFRDTESVNAAMRVPRKTIDGTMAVCTIAVDNHRNTNSDPDSSLRKNLYIGNIAPGYTEEDLHRDFQIHGVIEHADIMTDGPYGFVRYATEEAAWKAIQHNILHPTIAGGRLRIVRYANPRRRQRGRNPNPEYDQVHSHSQTNAVSNPPPPSVMRDRFGHQYYYDYSYP